ncbi:MAG: sugar phosphate nucleotidyltransferase [Bacteroidetes bacterium]|nr:sugar phosphate nucleotidyltransferase [Bacteroidota bacterium]
MKAVIPVAGVGTRLRPHTYALPKVLLNVAGKPILAHILDELVEYGITEATIITGYMGDLIENFVTHRYTNLKVDFVEQSQMLGLGHAIWTGKETYKENDELLIILGDTIFDVDLQNAITGGCSSIGVKKVEDPRRFGVVLLDANNLISKFVEKPAEPISNLAIVGMYYIKRAKKLVDALDTLITENIKTKNEYQLTDALQIMLEKGEKFNTFLVEGWYDCGKPETLLSTNKFLLEQYPIPSKIDGSVIIPPCFIAADANIKNSIIGPYTSIASGCEITDSIIKNSIISYEAKVSKMLLHDSIIGNEAEVKGTFNRYNVGNSSNIELQH